MPDNEIEVTVAQPVALPKLAFSMKETAQVIGVSYMTVHRLIQRGLLKASPHLRHKVIPLAEINRFLKM